MKWIPLIVALIATPTLADVTMPDGRIVDCYCTDSTGGRVELGVEICLFVNGRAFMARCEMSLNNPMWRDTDRGCVSSGLGQGLLQSPKPGLDPLAVDPEV